MSSQRDWAQSEAALKQEFIDLIPHLKSWGQEVDELILNILRDAGFDLGDVKIPPAARVKKVESFISKAFYREKSTKYTDPIHQINDKVATRLVLLTTNQIREVQQLLCSYEGWTAEIDKDISNEVELAPTQFGYQAAHIIVRQRQPPEAPKEALLSPIACEIQLKTLFQHAYSEVSHSTVYKGPYRQETELLRKLARSMAMMEAVDEYFHDMFGIINSPTSLPFAFSKEMTTRFGQLWPDFKKEDIDPYLYHSIFDRMYDASALSIPKLDKFVTQYEKPLRRIIANDRYHISRQPILIFVAYLLKNRPTLIETKWEFDDEILNEISGQMGISRERYDG
jgi:putative GTP pyrophosphokinase